MNATKNIANYIYSTGTRTLFVASTAVLTLMLTACALPSAPPRATVYDFGPGALTTQPANRMAALPPLALAEVEASAALDSTAVLYRLAYTDALVLRPYAQARWSMAPAQLMRQRVREHLSLRRAVLNPGESASAGASPANPVTLRLELEEFSQLFESATASTGLVRLRATVLQTGGAGEKLMGQKTFIVQSPAPSADAAGGARALTAATDAAVLELDQWLQQLR
jgi:cholesterol transport system auxiliary component